MSLALEGGFPTRLLDSRERGWLAASLRRLIARTAVLADQSVEAITEIAREDPYIPQTFRREEFYLLLAELACSIVSLRQEAGREAASAGLPTSVWLDAKKDGWRDDLPIALEGDGAAKLIDELVSQSVERLGGSGARCWRLLRRVGDEWSPALRLAVDGEARLPANVRTLQSRLRVYPSGILEDFVSGEIALLDPPGEDAAWIARPRPAAPRAPLLNFPFSASVEVELRVDGQRVSTLVWSPSGEPVHGEVLAFIDERESDDGQPNELAYIGSGSQRTKRSSIYAWAPVAYSAASAEGCDIPCLWQSDTHRLFYLREKAYLSGAADDLAFCLEPLAESAGSERLNLSGTEPRTLFSPREDRIYLGAPEITLKTGPISKKIGFSEVYWRRVGEQIWHDVRREKLAEGVIEIVWRSSESRVARDRTRIVVLPAELTVKSRGLHNGYAEFWLERDGAWRLEPIASSEYAAEPTERGFQAKWIGDARRKIRVRLVSAVGTIELDVRFPLGDGALLDADGIVFRNRESVKLARLRGARAVADGPSKLVIETTNAKDRMVYYQPFLDECSLWSARDKIAGLLKSSGDLDCEVRVGIEPNGPLVLVKRYEYDINVGDGRIALARPPRAQSGELSFRWLSLVDLSLEGRRTIARLSVSDAMSCRPFRVPEDLPGPGIVHLCEGEHIASRSRFVSGHPLDTAQFCSLQTAVLLEGGPRDAALKAAFDDIEREVPGAAADLRWLHELLDVYAEIPATTFEVLKSLSRRSGVLAHMIASSADEASLTRVWKLEPELPFLWVLIGIDDWRAAFLAQSRRMRAALAQLGWSAEQAVSTASAQTAATISALISLEENLRAPIAAAGFWPPGADNRRTPKEIGQDRIRRLAGSEQEGRAESCFMQDEQLLPELLSLREWYEGFHPEHWEGLQAPLVAALRAAGRAKLTSRHRLKIRDAMNDDPEHFADAYSAAIHQLVPRLAKPMAS